MNVYTLAALADLPLLVGGWLFLRRFQGTRSPVLLVASLVLGPVLWFGLAYLVLFVSFLLPACPPGRMAC
jgi:hypothetical protein